MHKSNKQRAHPTREEALTLFNHIRTNLRIKQREIALGIGLNQGSVSKILKGAFRDVEGRAYQVWEYANRRATEAKQQPQKSSGQTDSRLVEKISKVWDHTDEGAVALLKLLDAAALIQRRRKASDDL